MPTEARSGLGPLLVEISGVAGAGKSTVTSALEQETPRYKKAEFIRTRSPAHLIQVVRSLPRLLPVLAAGVVRKRRFGWADVKLMVYITQWRRFLRSRPEYADGVVLLDQGPIYALIRLKAKGLAAASTGQFRRWWSEMLSHWAEEIAVIVYLDAPDDILLSRINERPQSHVVKGDSTDGGAEFVRRYRSLFEEVLSHIEQTQDAEIWRFETSRTPVEQIVGEIRSALETGSAV